LKEVNVVVKNQFDILVLRNGKVFKKRKLPIIAMKEEYFGY